MQFLIDYHNVHSVLARAYPAPRRRIQWSQDIVDWVVDRLCQSLQNWHRIHTPSQMTCTLRLYSGWYLGTADSEQAGMVRRSLRNQQTALPGRVRFIYEIATWLISSPGEHIQHTLRPRELPSLHWLIPPTGCQCPASCGMQAIAECLRRDTCTVANCSVALSSATTRLEQKAVDSHIICDMLALAQDERIVLVSNDTDFIPALLMCAKSFPGQVCWMRIPEPNRFMASDVYHEPALMRNRIELHELRM